MAPQSIARSPSPNQKPAAHASMASSYSEDSSQRILAYLRKVELTPDQLREDIDEQCRRGRKVIERLALSATGMNDPRARLSLTDCADVLQFMIFSEPVDERTWWKEPDDLPSHLVGECFVLRAVQNRMRRGRP